MTQGTGAVAAIAMLEQNRLDVRVLRQQGNQLGAAVAAKADNSDRGLGHWIYSVCHVGQDWILRAGL